MKKNFFTLLITATLALASCQSEQIKLTQGHIKEMSDSSMLVKIDGYDISFVTKQAKYDNGAVMPGDSVVIHYVGDLREKHAVAAIVRLIPKPGRIVEAGYDPTKPLIVSDQPLTDKEKKDLDDFVKESQKYGH